MMHYVSHDFLSVNQLLMAAGAYSLAWLAGFVIPGAPGGLGVREFVLYALISPWVDDKVLLMAIASSRIVTTLGDVVFYIMGLIASVKPKLA